MDRVYHNDILEEFSKRHPRNYTQLLHMALTNYLSYVNQIILAPNVVDPQEYFRSAQDFGIVLDRFLIYINKHIILLERYTSEYDRLINNSAFIQRSSVNQNRNTRRRNASRRRNLTNRNAMNQNAINQNVTNQTVNQNAMNQTVNQNVTNQTVNQNAMNQTVNQNNVNQTMNFNLIRIRRLDIPRTWGGLVSLILYEHLLLIIELVEGRNTIIVMTKLRENSILLINVIQAAGNKQIIIDRTIRIWQDYILIVIDQVQRHNSTNLIQLQSFELSNHFIRLIQ